MILYSNGVKWMTSPRRVMVLVRKSRCKSLDRRSSGSDGATPIAFAFARRNTAFTRATNCLGEKGFVT